MTIRHVLTGFVALLLGCCTGCTQKGQKQGPQSEAVPVTTATVTPTSAVYYDEFPGIVTALEQVNLTSQVSGYVTGIHFRDGQQVRKGQLLYTIDAQVYTANYNQAVADLQVQQANLEKAKKDAARYQELAKHDAIAQQQVDYANAALQSAQKMVAAAEAQVAGLHSNVKFTRITAPFDGTIGISQVKVGAAVVAGQTLLNTVSTDNPMAVDFTVDQSDIYRFSLLKQEPEAAQDSVFQIAFGDAIYPRPGFIRFMDRAVDPQTGTMKVRLSFPNEKGLLKPGMNTTVRVKNTATKTATIIPHKAVREQLGEFTVFVLGDSLKVHQQVVQLGATVGDSVIVNSGLQSGQQIVVQGVQNLHEGSVVKTGK